MGKEREKAWKAAPLCLLWTCGRKEMAEVSMIRSVQPKISKYIFCYFCKLGEGVWRGHTLSLNDFIDWLFVK